MGSSKHCSICGVYIGGQDDYHHHRCNPAAIKKLDQGRAGHERADKGVIQGHTFAERLKDGFKLLGD